VRLIDLVRPDIAEFTQLKKLIESYKRSHGYYIIDLVDILSLKIQGIEGEQLLDVLFSEWDRPTAPKIDSPPENANWLDYQTDVKDSISLAISTLRGGAAVGHSVDTVPHEIATSNVHKFAKLFSNPVAYTGMGLGSQDYVFQQGTVLVNRRNAGILWVVEDD